MVGKLSVGVALILAAVIVGFAVARWLDPEPAVYEAVLRSIGATEVAVASAPGTCGVGVENVKDIPPPLVTAFRDANAPGAGFADVARLRTLVSVANSRQLAEYEAKGVAQWKAGNPALPVLRISRVGFSAGGSQALFCARSQRGAWLFHLQSSAGTWAVVHEEPLSTT